MLTDKEIQDIAQPFIRLCGDHWAHEEAIPWDDIEDFARAIEKATLYDRCLENEAVINGTITT